MALNDDLSTLREIGRRHVDDLSSALPAGGESPRGSALVKLVGEALNAMTLALDALPGEFASAQDDKDREAVVEKARGYTYQLRQLHMALPWVESASHHHVSQGTVLLFDAMAEAMLGVAADVIPTPNETYMYAVRAKPFRSAFVSVKKPYPSLSPPVIVYYPAGEVDSVFLHLIAAHELGHGAVLERDLIQGVKTAHGDLTPVYAKLSDAANALHNATALDLTLATAEVTRVFRNWLEELLCDALALSYLGPSFLLASATFGVQFSGSTPGSSHPSNAFRTHLLLEQLDAMGWTSEFQEELPQVHSWLADIASKPMDPSAGAHYEHIQDALDLLAATIRHVTDLRDLAFTPNAFTDRAELAELISARILPAQLLNGKPTRRRSVIYAGWLHAFGEAGDHAANLARITADRSLQAFLTKALEMSVILQKWESV
jgi:hypothetical protein